MNRTKSGPAGSGKSFRPAILARSPSDGRGSRPSRTSLLFTLRARLTIMFIIVALLPIAVVSFFNNRSIQQGLTNAANHSLRTAANQTAMDIDGFLQTNTYAISDEADLNEFVDYLSLPKEQQKGSEEERIVVETLESLYTKQYALNSQIQNYILMNREGDVLLTSSKASHLNFKPFLDLQNIDPYQFNLLLNTGYPYVSPVMVDKETQKTNIYFASRIMGQDRAVIGILVSQYSGNALQAIIDQNQNLAGEGSFPILLDENKVFLAHGTNSSLILKSVVPLKKETLTQLKNNGRLPSLPDKDLTTNLPSLAEGLDLVLLIDDPFFTAYPSATSSENHAGAVVSMQTKPWLVAYVQPQSIVFAPLAIQARNTWLLAGAVAVWTFVLALLVSNRLTSPITQLTKVAEKFAAGDLWVQAQEGRDEVGILAWTFNSMTSELRRTLEGLELRVAERTAELAEASEKSKTRAQQLQTVAEVAHAIASIQDPQELLNRVTHLISERFSYYHVGIFLLDEPGENAVLHAANSEGGQKMLSREHKLKVGSEGIVGYVTQHGEPRIALDVGKDAVFFNNPDLPYTRSEMALPLKAGGKVIGALDVQSMQQSAFTEEHVSLLGTLSDQVAVAIENARLFSETRKALDELQGMHRQYLQQEWALVASERPKNGYLYEKGLVTPLPAADTADVHHLVESGEPAVVISTSGEIGSSTQSTELVAPISFRGHIIGKLNLADIDRDHHWTEDDLKLVGAVADQIGQALENIRLLEQTQRRAEREHLVTDITSKLRSSNDPQTILQIAAAELRQALKAKESRIVIQPSPEISEPFPLPDENPPENGKDSGDEQDQAQV